MGSSLHYHLIDHYLGGVGSNIFSKFFPTSRKVKMRSGIAMFNQFEIESLYEAWERYNDLLKRVPHHGLSKWLQVQILYNSFSNNTRTITDATAIRALMSKTYEEAYEVLEEMFLNNYQ
ncbi:hypothetical protein Nepgr_024045 [Nepenthes gracilis]|uniref:Retrotransposon gag domain-containing protein n=1 Tax=Nepenthes gracilis TaxID=150966 RepID=A0AAD3T574_NEPGR|nr:hypothetical protein Nepgr_024045 [Nepenthes gracilis]